MKHWKDILEMRGSFRVRVNGSPVHATYHRRAVIGDRDITDQLRQIGLSDEKIFEDLGGYQEDSEGRIRWDAPEAQQLALRRMFGEITRGRAPWQVDETMLWEQVFPAGKELVVEHSYRPIPGWSFETFREDTDGIVRLDALRGHFQDDPCIDANTRGAIARKVRSDLDNGVTGSVSVWRNDVEYILATGRNWVGPIGLFKLQIEKAAAEDFVSLCFPGRPKKLTPTLFEFVEKNFFTQDKLVVNFYMIEPDPSESSARHSQTERAPKTPGAIK